MRELERWGLGEGKLVCLALVSVLESREDALLGALQARCVSVTVDAGFVLWGMGE